MEGLLQKAECEPSSGINRRPISTRAMTERSARHYLKGDVSSVAVRLAREWVSKPTLTEIIVVQRRLSHLYY